MTAIFIPRELRELSDSSGAAMPDVLANDVAQLSGLTDNHGSVKQERIQAAFDPHELDGLVAHFKCDDNAESTTVLNSAGFFGGTSIRNTSLLSVTGKKGTAFTLNGTSDFIDCGNYSHLQFSDGFTAAFWLKSSATQSNNSRHAVVSKMLNASPYNGLEVGIFNDNGTHKIYCGVGGLFATGSVNGCSVVNDGDWHYVVCTFGKLPSWQVNNAATPAIASTGASGLFVENVVYDDATEKFWCVMTDGDISKSVRLASASSILGPWTLESDGLFAGNMPWIVKFGSLWYIYYVDTSTQQTIYVRSSSTINGGYGTARTVVTSGGAGEWDEHRACEPCCVKIGDLYYLLYMGESVTTLYEKTGLAVGTSPTGPFTKYAGNPVLAGSTLNLLDSGQDRAADPYAFQLVDGSDEWIVGITACRSAKANWNVRFYRTRNFVDYELVGDANPYIRRKNDGTSWDSKDVLRGGVIRVGNTFYAAYTGRGESPSTMAQGGISPINFNGETTVHQVWVDGVLEGESINTNSLLLNTTQNLKIGQDLAGKYLACSVDELMLFNRALNPREISNLYQWAQA